MVRPVGIILLLLNLEPLLDDTEYSPIPRHEAPASEPQA